MESANHASGTRGTTSESAVAGGSLPPRLAELLSRPAVLDVEGTPVPMAIRLWMEVLSRHVGRALGAVCGRKVHCRLRCPEDDLHEGAGAAESDTATDAFAVTFQHPALAEPGTILIGEDTARMLADQVTLRLASLRGDGPLNEIERSLLEYLVLATVDAVLRAIGAGGDTPGAGSTASLVICGFASQRERGGQRDGLTRDLTFEIQTAGRRGWLRLRLGPWTAQAAANVGLPSEDIALPAGPVGWASPGAEVEIGLALPEVPLQREALAAMVPGDVLLIGRTTLQSFAAGCTLVTTTGWQLAPAELEYDQASVVSVKCGELRPGVRPGLIDIRSGEPPRLLPVLGRRVLSAGELQQWQAGHRLDLPKDLAAPVTLFFGAERIGTGELVLVDEELGIRVVQWDAHDRHKVTLA